MSDLAGNVIKNNATLVNNVTLVGLLGTWILTIGGLLWSVASTNATYDLRISHIEKELTNLDARLDVAETFRMEIRADLAEIKTDLMWIRKDLEAKN